MKSSVASEMRPAERQAARRVVQLIFKHDLNLPISSRQEEIMEAVRQHQVVIVAGDTGSGKSTQLPQYCLKMGRGIDGLIAHTQPRRLAARALATRVAEELSQPVGAAVGFRVRFADRVSESTRLILMTDGLLLAELTSDPLLRRYDTLIVDEAHERTLNIDLLLGVLKRLLPRRPELKLIVTSATLDVERVAQFFESAPIVKIGGRGFPIEVRHAAEAVDEEDPDLPSAVLAAYQDIAAMPGEIGNGDVLVFLPGEREIHDVGDLLQRELGTDVDVLELYSRLSWDQQSKIFQKGSRRRIVLATNVAETSITVPGIRAVIDTGLARISRYSPRNRLQRLPIEPISRASAEQRKGRCGRLGPGLCWRLYSETDFLERPAFTEPEVLRTNLAALLLRLAADGLGDAERFPFIDAPDSRALGDGYRLLQELQAFDAERRITRVGRAMARLPLDPRLARALLESKRFHAQAELLAITAGLSVPDARIAHSDGATEDPGGAASFDDSKSEFSGLMKLWRAYRKSREGPRRELRRWCKERGLSLLRLSEWEDVYAQVADRAAQIGIVAEAKPASYTGVHRSLLAGFCTMVGMRGEDGEYLGTRGVRFHISPGSPLKRRRPRWVMAANIVETSRVFARRVAEIEPTWVESAAGPMLKREFLEPDWNEAREEVVARERLSFLGLTVSANRVVNYGPIAPEEARLIFSREALVYHRLERRPEWVRLNDAAIAAAYRMEERLRTRDLVRTPDSFVDFYDKALPRQVSSYATLEYFTRHLSSVQRAALSLPAEIIFARAPDPSSLEQFPERVRLPALNVEVEYHFAPGEIRDGATLRVPLMILPTLTRAEVDAAVPGLAVPRIEALLRSLPKDARRGLIPIAAAAQEFVESSSGTSRDTRRLNDWLREARGIPESLIRFDIDSVPPHLTPQLAVFDGARELARGSDLAALRRDCATAARSALKHCASVRFPTPWLCFDAEHLPVSLTLEVEGGAVQVFPTLMERDRQLFVEFEWSWAEAQRSYAHGLCRLAQVVLQRQARDLAKAVAADVALQLAASPFLRSDALAEIVLELSFRDACFGQRDLPRTRAEFDTSLEQGRERLYSCFDEVEANAANWFAEARAVRRLSSDPRVRLQKETASETDTHLNRLLDPRSIVAASPDELRQLPRYLRAEERRWQRLCARGNETPQILRELNEWTSRAAAYESRAAAELRFIPELAELRLWIEEYRVSLYAQELRTLGPVSAARLSARAVDLDAWLTR